MTIEISASQSVLSDLVAAGIPLKDAAMFAGIPPAPRKLPSDAAGMVRAVIDAIAFENAGNDLAPEWLDEDNRTRGTPRARIYTMGCPFLEIPGNPEQVESQLIDIEGWVSACIRKQAPPLLKISTDSRK